MMNGNSSHKSLKKHENLTSSSSINGSHAGSTIVGGTGLHGNSTGVLTDHL